MDIRTPMASTRTAFATTPRRHRALFGSLLAAFILVTSGCQQTHGDTARDAPPAPMLVRQGERISVPANSPMRTRLSVATVDSATGAHALQLPAVVEADPARSVNIVPPLAGRLLALKVKLGDSVQQGQVLAVIAAPDLAQAYADADKARDARELARSALARAQGVNLAGANAAKDLEQARSNAAQAEFELTRADARLAALGADQHASGAARTRGLAITAPISGTITALNSGAGAYLNDTNATLMSIANLEQVWVTVNVPENLAGAVAKGQAAEVTVLAYPGQVRHGTVSFVSAVIEADTHRNKARIAFANADGKLKPNMYASVSLATSQTAAISVPASALLMNNDNTTVFVEVAPWTFQRRTVELGDEDGEQVRILSGLAAGERVLVRGGVLLND